MQPTLAAKPCRGAGEVGVEDLVGCVRLCLMYATHGCVSLYRILMRQGTGPSICAMKYRFTSCVYQLYAE